MMSVTHLASGDGFVAPPLSPTVSAALTTACQRHFEKDMGTFGGGGSIPFLNEMLKRFPGLQIVATGAAGPDSNAHNPDESLNLAYAEKFLHVLDTFLEEYGNNGNREMLTQVKSKL